ncbi:MAG: hypothetical protein U9R42_14865, partial [Bacteroidota bacterium]|nr:hypothetical protein [Bacteroidota bacterium]
MKNFFTIFLFLLIILQFSCKKEKPQWDTQILTPLINTDLSIKNLDTLVFENSDSSVSLIYKYIFQKIDCSKFLHIPDTTLANTAALKTIKLGTREVEKKNTLGQIARENGAMGQIILNNHGSKMIIPQIPSSNVGNVNIDASGLFESIDVLDGVLIAKMHNGLPIEIRDVIYILKNKSSGARLLIDTIHSLMPNQDYTESYSLDGKTFEGKLVMEILNFSSPGTGIIPVLIDTNDALTIKVTIKIDELSSAIAIFPEQNLFDHQEDVEYHLNGQELVSMRLREGTFKFIAISTIQDSCFIDYSIPGAKYLGTDPLQVYKVLPPAMEGDTVYIEETNNVGDYWFDLTGKNGNKVNSFYRDLKMRIDSTGKMIHLSLEDSIYLYYTLFDVVPEYVKGYLGQDSFSYSAVAKIDIFKNITKGKLGIEDVSFRFFTENGVGADAEILINKIEAKNNKTKLNKILSSTILNNP